METLESAEVVMLTVTGISSEFVVGCIELSEGIKLLEAVEDLIGFIKDDMKVLAEEG